jgi:hypothetical protein
MSGGKWFKDARAADPHLALHGDTHWSEIEAFNERTLQTLKLSARATPEEMNEIRNWQFPMYPLDLREIGVTEAELAAERVAWVP